MYERMSTKLRSLLKQGMVSAPGCYDALTARCCEVAGFDAAYLSGYCFEVTHNGTPDLGFTTNTELAEACNRITSAIQIPLVVDCDTGFGGTLNIHRTVRLLERADVAAIHIEDQSIPKQCVAIRAGTVISRQEAVDRIKAALDARTDPDFLIIGRTESSYLGFDEVTERCNLFLEAGADMVMPIWGNLKNDAGVSAFHQSPAEQLNLLKRLAQAIHGPIVNQGSRPPQGYTDADLEAAGIRLQIYAGDFIGAVTAAMFEALQTLKDTGSTEAYLKAHPAQFYDAEVQQLMHQEEYLRIADARWEF